MGEKGRQDAVLLTGEDLTPEEVLGIAIERRKVMVSPKVEATIREFRAGLERYMKEHPRTPIYGVNRGCGDLLSFTLKPTEWEGYLVAFDAAEADPKNRQLQTKRDAVFSEYLDALAEYQTRYIRSHNCGTGAALPSDVVRAILVIRLNSFAKGVSAVRLELCQQMVEMLNRGVTPWVLEEGSVGASGDLVPLAMVAASMMGMEGAKSELDGKLLDARAALEAVGLDPLPLAAKEAMAITNGASFTTAIALFALNDAERLLDHASIAAALSVEAIRGEPKAFGEFLASLRPHPGSVRIAHQMRTLLADSGRATIAAQKIRLREDQDPATLRERIQDRYSFRAVPQVHGAASDAVRTLREVLTTELNSATDNPLFRQTEDGLEPWSGANFHGQPMAGVIDYAKAALTAVALISDKRSFAMLDRCQNYGLPAALAADGRGGDSGLLITQYAGAARAAENRILSTPASVMSISTSANQEDFVSMSSIGALHLRKVIENLEILIGIELLCALRAIQLSQTTYAEQDAGAGNIEILKKLGRGTQKAYRFLDARLPTPEKDRYMRNDIEAVIGIVRSRALLDELEHIFGIDPV